MIKKPNNWESVSAVGDYPKLPAGGYVCKIKQAVVNTNDYGNQICVLFDIINGDFANYFEADFKSNQREDKKWRGVLRVWLPKDDGTEKDEWTKSILKGFITSVESSNLGFHFDWDESKLAGREVGIIFRNEEWEYNGKSGWSARPFRAATVDAIINNTYRMPEDKPLTKTVSTAPAQPNFGSVASAPDPFASIYGSQNFVSVDDESEGTLPF